MLVFAGTQQVSFSYKKLCFRKMRVQEKRCHLGHQRKCQNRSATICVSQGFTSGTPTEGTFDVDDDPLRCRLGARCPEYKRCRSSLLFLLPPLFVTRLVAFSEKKTSHWTWSQATRIPSFSFHFTSEERRESSRRDKYVNESGAVGLETVDFPNVSNDDSHRLRVAALVPLQAPLPVFASASPSTNMASSSRDSDSLCKKDDLSTAAVGAAAVALGSSGSASGSCGTPAACRRRFSGFSTSDDDDEAQQKKAGRCLLRNRDRAAAFNMQACKRQS